ncbi:hypothetical protein MHA_0178 [Mannheimia haemolytica PHL213]|nr:hypothetical protein MHA_0178 [Mannheimia haemolytica PHL213]
MILNEFSCKIFNKTDRLLHIQAVSFLKNIAFVLNDTLLIYFYCLDYFLSKTLCFRVQLFLFFIFSIILAYNCSLK